MENEYNISVLGTEYLLKLTNKLKDYGLENCDGYHDFTTKVCAVDISENHDSNAIGDIGVYIKQVIRHELIHAFLSESGLNDESWANNEEIVDWIAFMFPKMLKAFQLAQAL